MRTKTDYDNFMKKQIDQILLMLYALLAMSVTISIFGIVNTLVLSVYERTREIGMLRAIGTSRRQMRRIVRYESVITSVIGGVLGTAVGVLFGYVITNQFGDQGLVFSVPYAPARAVPRGGEHGRRAGGRAARQKGGQPQRARGRPLRVTEASARALGVTGRTARGRGGRGGDAAPPASHIPPQLTASSPRGATTVCERTVRLLLDSGQLGKEADDMSETQTNPGRAASTCRRLPDRRRRRLRPPPPARPGRSPLARFFGVVARPQSWLNLLYLASRSRSGCSTSSFSPSASRSASVS